MSVKLIDVLQNLCAEHGYYFGWFSGDGNKVILGLYKSREHAEEEAALFYVEEKGWVRAANAFLKRFISELYSEEEY